MKVKRTDNQILSLHAYLIAFALFCHQENVDHKDDAELITAKHRYILIKLVADFHTLCLFTNKTNLATYQTVEFMIG